MYKMIVPIFKYGAQVLRKTSSEIIPGDDPAQLSENLFSTLKNARGIGLAAPQIGILKRAFVIDTTPMKDEPGIEIFEQAYFNPEIIWRSSGKTTFKEGCLSIPEIFEDVLRPERIRVIHSNHDGETIEEELEGIKARIFQHEYDHLLGVLFIDKINPLRRKVISGKLKKIKNQ